MKILVRWKWVEGVCQATAKLPNLPGSSEAKGVSKGSEEEAKSKAIGNLVRSNPRFFLVEIEEETRSAASAAA